MEENDYDEPTRKGRCLMGVRMIPIVAVVSEDTFHALNDLMSKMPPVPAGMLAVMGRNG